MGVSSTRVGDHRGSARTVQFSFSSSESSEVRTTHPSINTWAQKNTWAKSRHSPSTGLGRILFSRPSSPRCLTHIHVGVGFSTALGYGIVALSIGLAVVCLVCVGSIPTQPLQIVYTSNQLYSSPHISPPLSPSLLNDSLPEVGKF